MTTIKFGSLEISYSTQNNYGDEISVFNECKLIKTPFKDIQNEEIEKITLIVDNKLSFKLYAETIEGYPHKFIESNNIDFSSFTISGNLIFGNYEFSYKSIRQYLIENNNNFSIYFADCEVVRSPLPQIRLHTLIPIITVSYFLNNKNDRSLIFKVTFHNLDDSEFSF